MILFLKLFLAHLLGDFVLQSERWVREKTSKKHKSPKLYLHALIHGMLSLVLVGQISFWPYALLITLSHLLIDWSKTNFQSLRTQKTWFFLDQLLHLGVLLAVVYWATDQSIHLSFMDGKRVLLLTTAIVFLTLPTSIIVKLLISGWTPKTYDNKADSLESAGKYIGILERLFVFLFILNNHWEAIGFFLAAKSVFRFGDLKESRERKLTEYVLIGTMLSFGIAMLTGIITTRLW